MAFSSHTSGPPRVGTAERGLAAGLAAMCLAVLVTAASLTPAAEGHGTHQQLGLPACAWAMALDKPCPTCGMTTSFSYAANGDWAGSVRTQPFAALLVVLCSTLFWGGLHAAVTGVRTGPYAAAMIRPRTLIAGTALAGAAWMYKIVTWTG